MPNCGVEQVAAGLLKDLEVHRDLSTSLAIDGVS